MYMFDMCECIRPLCDSGDHFEGGSCRLWVKLSLGQLWSLTVTDEKSRHGGADSINRAHWTLIMLLDELGQLSS